jgi:hypothetical protein
MPQYAMAMSETGHNIFRTYLALHSQRTVRGCKTYEAEITQLKESAIHNVGFRIFSKM